jgi:transcriptional regulator with GAF, ATPase, and Fis domain
MEKRIKELLLKVIPNSLIEALYDDNGITATEANTNANNAANQLYNVIKNSNKTDSVYQVKETIIFTNGNPDRVKVNSQQKLTKEIIDKTCKEIKSGTLGRIAVNYKKNVLIQRLKKLKDQDMLGEVLGIKRPVIEELDYPVLKSVLVEKGKDLQQYFEELENGDKECDQLLTDLIPEVFEDFSSQEIKEGLSNGIKAAFLGKLINSRDSFVSRLQTLPTGEWNHSSKTEQNYIIETCNIPLYSNEEATDLISFIQTEYRNSQQKYNALLAKIKDKATSLQNKFNKEFFRLQQERNTKVKEYQNALNLYNTEVNNIYEELVKAVQTIKIAYNK